MRIIRLLKHTLLIHEQSVVFALKSEFSMTLCIPSDIYGFLVVDLFDRLDAFMSRDHHRLRFISFETGVRDLSEPQLGDIYAASEGYTTNLSGLLEAPPHYRRKNVFLYYSVCPLNA